MVSVLRQFLVLSNLRAERRKENKQDLFVQTLSNAYYEICQISRLREILGEMQSMLIPVGGVCAPSREKVALDFFRN